MDESTFRPWVFGRKSSFAKAVDTVRKPQENLAESLLRLGEQ